MELTSGLAEKKENSMSEYCLPMKEATNLGSPVEVQLFAEEADIIKVVEVVVLSGCVDGFGFSTGLRGTFILSTIALRHLT